MDIDAGKWKDDIEKINEIKDPLVRSAKAINLEDVIEAEICALKIEREEFLSSIMPDIIADELASIKLKTLIMLSLKEVEDLMVKDDPSTYE